MANKVLITDGEGTSGQVLTSNGASSAPTFQNAGGGGGAWELVDYSSGTAVSSLEVTGLDLSTDLEYEIKVIFESASTTARNVKMQINSITSGSTYNQQMYEMYFTGSSSGEGNRNQNGVDYWNLMNNSSANSLELEGSLTLRSDGSNIRPVLKFTSSVMGSGATGVAYNRSVIASCSQSSQANVTSIKVYQTAGTGNWKMWIRKPNTL